MQKSEKRADPRRTIRYPGLITLDGEAEPIPCALRNASQQGSQLAVSDVDKVPDESVLVLGHEGTQRRFCRVVWRSKDAVGVEFNAAP